MIRTTYWGQVVDSDVTVTCKDCGVEMRYYGTPGWICDKCEAKVDITEKPTEKITRKRP